MAPNASESPSLSITLFGPMQVQVHGRPLPSIRSRKSLWTLALLTIRQNRPVQREWLAGTLWPETDQNRASTNLRVVLSELRRALGDQRDRLQSPNRHSLTLNLDGAEVDLHAFDAALVSKKRSDLLQAVDLYRGPLMEGCGEDWIVQERIQREQDCLGMLQTLAETDFTDSRYDEAARWHRRALGLDPWRESSRRGLMEALAKSGDGNAAMETYQEFVRLLQKDNPRALPDPSTTALYSDLRAAARRRSTASATATTSPSQKAPLVAGYLPHPITALIGREDECAEVISALGRSRLVTLTGSGGIGKTRLALCVATEIVAECFDGVRLISMEALSDGSGVPRQIAVGFDLKEETGRSSLELATDHLRTKRLLLVLDNCEHLLKECALAAEHLLRECPDLRILTTSREALGILGETAWSVPALATPDPAHLPDSGTTQLRVLQSYDSVQLFVERAQAVRQTFSVTRENAQALAEICHRLEGIPLALELAAARVKAMSVEQIAMRLGDALGLLTNGTRNVQSRHQTLRAALDWSFALLSASEQSLIQRLSVFTGGWTIEFAEKVCASEPIDATHVLDLMTSLVDKSLVVFEERDGFPEGRFRMLEMVRQYAAERLILTGEADAVKDRHREVMVEFAEKADMQLSGSEQNQWLKRLDTERDNLRAALSWNAGIEGAEAQLRLVGWLWRFWDFYGFYAEGRLHLQRALDRPEVQEDSIFRARALNGSAGLALRQADLTSARLQHQQGLAMQRRLGNRNGIAVSLSNEGTVAWSQGEYADARALFEESLAIRRETNNKLGIALTLQSLGQLVQWQGDYALATMMFKESLELHKDLGDTRSMSFLLDCFGNMALIRGEYAQACAHFEASLQLRIELGDRYGIALATGSLGLTLKALGDHAYAQETIEQATEIFNELGDKQGSAQSLNHLGLLRSEQGEHAQGLEMLEQALTMLRQIGDRDSIAMCLCALGRVGISLGEYTLARTRLQESLAIRFSLRSQWGIAETLETAARLLLAEKETQSAATLWGAAQNLRNKLGAPMPLNERKDHQTKIGQSKAVLGEAEFDSCWNAGLEMTMEEAVRFAERGL